MKNKNLRHKRIRELLRRTDESLTISEIHDTLYENSEIVVSRKTTQRDVEELIEKEEIRQIQDVPLKVSFLKNEIVPINLKLEEALFVISLLKELGPLNGCELIAEKIIQKVEEAV